MERVIDYSLPIIGALLLALMFIPLIKNFAARVGLIDKPNARKVHSTPVPLAGGIAIAMTTIVVLLLNPKFMEGIQHNFIWLTGAIIMLVIGALDDRFDIKPSYRLLIQLGCAFAVAYSGIRINSFYGLFGIEEIPVLAQYILTVVVITGVVNAYNLMDGIDGLIGGLSLVGALVLGILSYTHHHQDIFILCLTLSGAIIGFLRHNLSRKKIFMGDAGSLFLGFSLVVIAIKLLNSTEPGNSEQGMKIFLFVSGIFLVPVLDSLRVYRARIKRGGSPFKADKTHLHHLFLYLGLTHRRASLMIVVLSSLILLVVVSMVYLVPVTWVIIIGIMIFSFITWILTINNSMREWRTKLEELERE